MTDSNGYYKFTRCAKGKHTVKAVNKYPDYYQEWYYKPFDYTPEKYEIDLTQDTSGFDFNAIDTLHFIAKKDLSGIETKQKSCSTQIPQQIIYL